MKRNIARYIIILFMLILSIEISAQNKCIVTGAVIDRHREPISYASVVLFDEGNILTGCVTDEKGRFSLAVNTSVKELELSVEFIGYVKKTMTIFPDDRSLNIGNIILEEGTHLLDEAVVMAGKEAQKSSLELTSINAAANMTSSKGSAIDVLSSASSVTISNDIISIRGNSNILVLMDGIPTTVSNLSAIPAANINNIDIITNPDASYDAGGTGGIINIVSKKVSTKGFSGVVAANYGFNHFVTVMLHSHSTVLKFHIGLHTTPSTRTMSSIRFSTAPPSDRQSDLAEDGSDKIYLQHKYRSRSGLQVQRPKHT